MRLGYLAIVVFLAATPAYAGNAPSYTAATTPYTGSELWYCDQGGADRGCTVGNIMSNAQLDRVSGLTSATVPQFLYRNGAGSYVGSFLGTSQSQWHNYAGQFETSAGTSGALNTFAGPVVKISRTGAPASTSCVNAVDSECDAAIAAYATQDSTGTDQTTAGYFAANSASVATGGTVGDAVGVTGSGRITGSGVGVGTGAYMEGRRDTTTGGSLGAEIRSWNVTASNCNYNTTGIGQCDGYWVTAAGNGTNATHLSTAVHIATADSGVNASIWNAGLGLNTTCCATYGIDDASAATVGINENGTHTYALVTGTAAGKTGLGTLTPTYQLDVVGQIRASQAFLDSSAAPTLSACGSGTPTANAGSSNSAGQFTTGTGGTVTACTVTFANAYPNNAFCVVSPGSATTTSVYVSSQTNAAFIITFAPATASQLFNYVCGGK